jgi:hypothetical protein
MNTKVLPQQQIENNIELTLAERRAFLRKPLAERRSILATIPPDRIPRSN